MDLNHFSVYVVVETPPYKYTGSSSWVPATAPSDTELDEDTTDTVNSPSDSSEVTKADIAKGTLSLNKKTSTAWKGNSIVLTWGKVKNADGYDVYAAKYGSTEKLVKSIGKNSTTSLTIKKISKKSVSKNNAYQATVKAYRMIDGEKVYTGESYTLYTVGSGNSKYTDLKSLKISKKSISLSKGKSEKLSVKKVKASSKKKLLPSSKVAAVRYFSTNTSVAKVTSSGKVKAVAQGSCTVYAVAANGVKTSVKITVK
jgi:hypothetical protein